jgi:hypothetical protein
MVVVVDMAMAVQWVVAWVERQFQLFQHHQLMQVHKK